MLKRIQYIKYLPNSQMLVSFEDKTIFYDFKKLFDKIEIFRELSNQSFFESGKIIAKGCGICWSDDLDISSDELYSNGYELSMDTDFCVMCRKKTPSRIG